MKYSELKKLLKKNGCSILREGASHEQWYSPKTGKKFSVGRHNTEEVKKRYAKIHYERRRSRMTLAIHLYNILWRYLYE